MLTTAYAVQVEWVKLFICSQLSNSIYIDSNEAPAGYELIGLTVGRNKISESINKRHHTYMKTSMFSNYQLSVSLLLSLLLTDSCCCGQRS